MGNSALGLALQRRFDASPGSSASGFCAMRRARTLDTTLVHPREVFKAAVLANAAAIIVSHNHPSGDTSP